MQGSVRDGMQFVNDRQPMEKEGSTGMTSLDEWELN
jgi:hypothetical protein